MRPLGQVLSLATCLIGCVLVLGSTASAHHADHTHNNPEAILTGLENSDLPDKVVKNNGTTNYLVTSDTDVLDTSVDAVVTNWNNGLRNFTPNNLTKFPFHKNAGYDDPAANVRVIGYTNVSPNFDFSHRCFSSGSHACVQDEITPDDDSLVNFYAPTLYVIVNLTLVTTDAHERGDIAHELGHVLFFNEHYVNLQTCGSFTSVMDLWECDGQEAPTTHDRQDFFDAYKPQDVPGPSTMSMSGSSTVTLNWSNSQQHNIARFYFNRQTDTNGSFVDEGYTTDKATTNKQYTSVADNARYCAKANGVSDAGFQGGNIFSPRTFFGCWIRKNGSAGRFMATSHRAFGSELRVKNLSGATRSILILGPALQNVGCSTQNISNNSTYSCTASVSIGQYPDLLIVMTNTGTGAQTLGALDYD